MILLLFSDFYYMCVCTKLKQKIVVLVIVSMLFTIYFLNAIILSLYIDRNSITVAIKYVNLKSAYLFIFLLNVCYELKQKNKLF